MPARVCVYRRTHKKQPITWFLLQTEPFAWWEDTFILKQKLPRGK